MQATGAEIMRCATIRSMEQDLGLVECLHDGFLFESPAECSEESTRAIVRMMEEVSAEVLGAPIPVETKITAPGEHFIPEKGIELWQVMMETMDSRTASATV